MLQSWEFVVDLADSIDGTSSCTCSLFFIFYQRTCPGQMSSEKTETEVKTSHHHHHIDKLSGKIIRVRRERIKNGQQQYCVMYEGGDSKKGIWVNEDVIEDKKLIEDYLKKKEKKEKKKEKEIAKEEKSKTEDTKSPKPKKSRSDSKQKYNVDKIEGLVRDEENQNEKRFLVKIKDGGFEKLTVKELKDNAPEKFIDFLVKKIEISQ